MVPAISIRNLGKRYRVNNAVERAPYRTLRDSLTRAAAAPLRRLRGETNGKCEDFWALKDVEFDVQPGEVVGIIGRNGAGKSTLLKILSRITSPTTGEVAINGRVGSLLEVGTGFHPELTGRENIFMNGSILGMSRREISRKFDEIVSFSEIEMFLDTPVKRYSSGMYVRLAFAVAAFLEPDILVVDEVLAVGDAQFQKKCIGRMEHIGRKGRTVLFVTHNMVALQSLCSQVIWLESGRVRKLGSSQGTIEDYLGADLTQDYDREWPDRTCAPGNDKVRICRASVVRPDGLSGVPLTVRTAITLQFEYLNLVPGARINLSVFLRNAHGTIVFNSIPAGEPQWHGKPFPCGLYRSTCYIPGDILNDGFHSVDLLVVRDQCAVVHREDGILSFDVLDNADGRGDWHGNWPGVVRPQLRWETLRLHNSDRVAASEGAGQKPCNIEDAVNAS